MRSRTRQPPNVEYKHQRDDPILSRSRYDDDYRRERPGSSVNNRGSRRDSRERERSRRYYRSRQRTPQDPAARGRDEASRRQERRRSQDRNPFRADQNPFAKFQFPTDPQGKLSHALSTIACNAEARAQGVFSKIFSGVGDNFRDVINHALTLKLDLKQQANEKSFATLINSKGSATDLRQALQARAALYGNALSPSWFVQNFDLSAKAQNLNQRRLARSMFLGAVLLVTQLGAHQIRTMLTKGKSGVLKNLRPDAHGTTLYFKKMLQEAPLIEVLQFLTRIEVTSSLDEFYNMEMT